MFEEQTKKKKRKKLHANQIALHRVSNFVWFNQRKPIEHFEFIEHMKKSCCIFLIIGFGLWMFIYTFR